MPETPETPEVDRGAAFARRRFLQGAAAVGAAGALTLAPLRFAEAAEGEQTMVIEGRLEVGAPDWVYLPVEVPRGVREIAVSYTYDRPPVPDGVLGNALDIGVFDQRGTRLGGRGFRGWSGGFRTSFSISRTEATPGYLPGRIGAGTWFVVLGPYQVAPQGLTYRVEVTLRFGPDGPAFVPSYAPDAVPGTGSAWYRGDCHLHTVHSDGRRLPEEVAAEARAAGVDFIVSTEHNTSSAHAVWGPLAGDDLLVLNGEEVTTRNGHWLALGLPPGEWVDWRYRAVDEEHRGFARDVRRAGGLVVAAHPYCPFVGCRWKFGFDEVDLVEVWNGPWTLDDDIAVEAWDAMLVSSARQQRRWVPAMGNSDAHNPGQVVALPQTVVRADALSRDALVDGLAAGRSWIAESSAVEFELTVTGGGAAAGLGERLEAALDAPVDVSVRVAGVPDGYVRLVTDQGQVLRAAPDVTGVVTWRTTPSQSAYVRAEVRHATTVSPGAPYGTMAAMTNPVFLR